jgi:hypothetical protein
MRKRKVKGIAVEGGSDYGPSLRLGRDGRLRPWGGASDVVVETRDDPAITTRRTFVRGTRRRNGLAELVSRKTITKRMQDVAEQFLDDCSIAIGASACGITGLPAVHGSYSGFPERQLNAITRVNRIRHLLGLNNGTIFWWVVFDNRGIRDWETLHKAQPGTGSVMLRDALNALDAHYQTGRKTSDLTAVY